MAVNIDAFKRFQEYISNKSQNGGTLTTAQFNEVCNRAQMTLFERDYQTFLVSEKISEYLKTFLKNSVFSVPATGEYMLPSDFQHLSSLRKYFVNATGGRMIQIKEINNVAYGLAQISSLNEPSLRFPKFNEFSGAIRFLPKTIGICEADYFRTPVAPIWGSTQVNGRPVYDSATSTNFEWDDFATNSVAAIFLSLIGVNLSDQNILNFSQMYKKENESIL